MFYFDGGLIIFEIFLHDRVQNKSAQKTQKIFFF